MGKLTFFLGAWLLAFQPVADPAVSDAEQIMRVVLSTQARTVREGGWSRYCVKERTPEAAFAALRRALIERDSRPPSASASNGATSLEKFLWLQPKTRTGHFGLGARLTAKEELPISEAIRAITRGPEPPHLVHIVDAAWLPGELALCRGEPEQPYLEIGSPTVQGDIAFVDADYFCPLCGQGSIYALKRDGSTWKIVAIALLWQS